MPTVQFLLAVCLYIWNIVDIAKAQDGDVAGALLSLPAACTNWQTATAALPGAPWAAGTPPCGNASVPPWRGITCGDAGVKELRLPGLGLAGTLPPELAQVATLQALDLSGNAFTGNISAEWLSPDAFSALAEVDFSSNPLTGPLPDGLPLLASRAIRAGSCQFTGSLPSVWRSDTLTALDLSYNRLSYVLPTAWGEKTSLPALSELFLEGNNIRGPLPDPQWTSVGFAAPCRVTLRPGNANMCGPVLALVPQLYDPATIDTPAAAISQKPLQGLIANVTTLIVTHVGLFDPDSEVTVSNTLGSCALPCQNSGLGSTAATVSTNFYDVMWQMNVSAADLLALNPASGAASAGALLQLPCYPPDRGLVNGIRLSPRYFGSDVAFLQFTGGNQRPGAHGLDGAMAASGTNDHPPNQNDFDSPYTGSRGGASGLAESEVVQPVYLFVDLQAEFKVAAVVVTAGTSDLRNASVYVGSDTSGVQRNTLVAAGINVAAKSTMAVPAGMTRGRYAIVYTGMLAEGQMSVADLQVYAAETNAAAYKPAAVSGIATSATAVLVDGKNTTCLDIQPGSGGGPAWAAVDLGYTGTVGSVVLSLGPNSPANTTLSVSVSSGGLGASYAEATPCTAGGVAIPGGGGWVAVPCNATGSAVIVSALAAKSFELCEIQVALTQRPQPPSSTAVQARVGRGGLSAGVVAGIAAGAVAAAALAVLALLYTRRQLRRAKGAARPALVSDKDTLNGAEHGIADSSASYKVLGQGDSGVPPGAPGSDVARLSSLSQASPRGAVPAFTRSGSAGTRATSAVSTGSSGTAEHSLPDASATDLSKLPHGFIDVKASEFEVVRSIGEGSFGQVFLAKYCETTVAVKMLTHQSAPSAVSTLQHANLLRNLHREASLMSRLRHPNVCQYLGACSDPPCLLMELCSRRSVDVVLAQGVMDAKVAKQLAWGRLLSMALDSAKGMLYLHSRTPPIAHRDLKSANLLVDTQWRVKVADFNLSREAGPDAGSSLVAITNPRWLAPEVLSGHAGGLPADVWAFGTVLWELATWRLPFDDKANAFQVITHVQSHPTSSGLVVPPPEELPAGGFPGWGQYVALMHDCWRRDGAARPTFEAIVKRLRALLGAEMTRQRQQRQHEGLQAGSPPATLSLAVTPRSGALVSSGSEGAGARPLAAAVMGGDAAAVAAVEPAGAAASACVAARSLEAASPFAAVSRKDPPPAL